MLFVATKRIVPNHMVKGAENRQVESTGEHALTKVAHFSGEDLHAIGVGATSYFAQNPGRSRAYAAKHLAYKGAKPERIEKGFDVLNQLHIVGRTGEDVYSVTVYEETGTTIQRAEGKRIQAGEGTPHLRFEINWINPPEEKTVVPQSKAVNPAPFDSTQERAFFRQKAEERRTRRERRVEAREKARVQQEELERILARRRRVDSVVIDSVLEDSQLLIKGDRLKIELDESGNAKILFKDGRGRDYTEVDKETGIYTSGFFFTWEEKVDQSYLRYFTVLAEQAEGKNASYTPKPLSRDTCAEAFARGVEERMIKVVVDPESGTQFHYLEFPNFSWSDNLVPMDLQNNTITENTVWETRQRPIHPDFAAFLREIKDKMDQHLQKRSE